MRARNVKSKTADVQAAAEPTPDVQSNRTKEEKPRKLRYGPLGLKHEHKAWSRAVLFTGVLVIALVFKWRKSPVVTWVSQKPIERTTSHSMACASGYAKEIARFEGRSVSGPAWQVIIVLYFYIISYIFFSMLILNNTTRSNKFSFPWLYQVWYVLVVTDTYLVHLFRRIDLKHCWVHYRYICFKCCRNSNSINHRRAEL